MDDGDPCTGALHCTEDNQCEVDTLTVPKCEGEDGCSQNVCDPETGACVWQSKLPEGACDDGDDCTLDLCNPATGECVHAPDPACP